MRSAATRYLGFLLHLQPHGSLEADETFAAFQSNIFHRLVRHEGFKRGTDHVEGIAIAVTFSDAVCYLIFPKRWCIVFEIARKYE